MRAQGNDGPVSSDPLIAIWSW